MVFEFFGLVREMLMFVRFVVRVFVLLVHSVLLLSLPLSMTWTGQHYRSPPYGMPFLGPRMCSPPVVLEVCECLPASFLLFLLESF